MLQSPIFPRFSDAEYKRRHDLVRAKMAEHGLDAVIPGRREAASPESIFQGGGYGFRARAFGASRNDNNSGS